MRLSIRTKLSTSAPAARCGGALITVIVLTAVVTVLAGAALTVTSASVSEVESERQRTQALFAAEAGINAGLGRIATAYHTGNAVDAFVGTKAVPDGGNYGRFYGGITDNADDTFTIMATGTVGLSSRTIEVVVQPVPPGPMDHAVFAGNLSGDSAYSLDFGGTGGQADLVNGDIYSGGDLNVSGDASITGQASAAGTITGTAGQTGVKMTIPKILKTDYEKFHDYDVATMFSGAPAVSDDAGGTANQLPATSAAHIFRKNPSDRAGDVNSTAKDDYFMEDPYEAVTSDAAQDGSNAYLVSLPADANGSVYFIDGNLWLHNTKTMSFKIKNDGPNPTRVTFVVKGNVYFSDNFFYGDPNTDGVAFIALADKNVADSGNIYFGDPSFGTMQFAESMFFAERNFYDNNLDEAGSTNVEIRGNMTAGNQVAIERDYKKADGTIAHTQLKLTFDNRQAAGGLNLPGIPVAGDHKIGYVVATWREVPTPMDVIPPQATFSVDVPAAPPDSTVDWRLRWLAKFGLKWKQEARPSVWLKN